MTAVRLTGWGTALPDKTVTNADLEGWLDTSDEWIRERTGIAERRVGSSTTELAVEAAREAIERSPGPVDLVLVATITPDQATPATASRLASRGAGAERSLKTCEMLPDRRPEAR